MSDLEQQLQALKLPGLLAHSTRSATSPGSPSSSPGKRRSAPAAASSAACAAPASAPSSPSPTSTGAGPRRSTATRSRTSSASTGSPTATNVVLVGPNGVGKTLIAKNLAHQAVLAGATVRTLTASELLNTLADQATSHSLQRKIGLFCRPQLLLIDELGYLSYDARHADLLFEVVSRRYLQRPILLTTNKPFAEWNEVFPNATSVVTLVDRLVHRSERRRHRRRLLPPQGVQGARPTTRPRARRPTQEPSR